MPPGRPSLPGDQFVGFGANRLAGDARPAFASSGRQKGGSAEPPWRELFFERFKCGPRTRWELMSCATAEARGGRFTLTSLEAGLEIFSGRIAGHAG